MSTHKFTEKLFTPARETPPAVQGWLKEQTGSHEKFDRRIIGELGSNRAEVWKQGGKGILYTCDRTGYLMRYRVFENLQEALSYVQEQRRLTDKDPETGRYRNRN